MNYTVKRKLIVYGILFSVLSLFAFIGYDSFIKEKPTCFDNTKNGEEEGVDCGGNCQKICAFKSLDVNVEWSKAFKINKDNFYNVAALVQNPNFNYEVSLDYKIKYLNKGGLVVGEKEGTVDVKPLEEYIIFYPGLKFTNQEIVKTFFKKERIYNLREIENIEEKKIIVNAKEVLRETGSTKLKVILENTDYKPHRDIQIYGLLMDDKGGVINMSRTYLEYIDQGSRKDVYMTWPYEVEENIAKIKIIIKEERL